MILDFTVKRERYSVTQGNATVYLNGEKILVFADEIKLIKDGETYYGEIIEIHLDGTFNNIPKYVIEYNGNIWAEDEISDKE